MTSLIRRAGANVLRTIARALEPGAETNKAQLYSQVVSGTPIPNAGQPQMFVRSPDFGRQISGIECNVWDRPLQPNALDDEFESTTLSPSWTAGGGFAPGTMNPFGNPGNVYELHTNRRPSWLMFQCATGTNILLTKDISSIAGGDFFVWMRASFNLRYSGVTSNDVNLALDISSPGAWSSTNRVGVNVNESDANATQAEFSEVEGGVGTIVGNSLNLFATNTGIQPIEAVGIQKIGTTYHGWAFTGAGQGTWLGQTTYAAAIGTISLRAEIQSTAAPGTMIMGVDFFRFKTGAVFLP